MEYNRVSLTNNYIYDYRFLFRFNKLLLVFHLIFLMLFFYAGYYILAIVNIFSVSYYLFFLRYSKNNLSIYSIVTFIEVIVHAMAVILLMGWDYGFQYYFFALVPIFYFISHHLGYEQKEDSKLPLYSSLALGLLLAILKTISFLVEPLYVLKSDWISFLISQLNLIISVGFIIYFVREYQKVVRRNEIVISDIAQTDQLTRVYNRHYMTEVVSRSLSGDCTLKPVALAIMDIDDFKNINDSFGHLAGDEILVKIAEMIKDLSNKQIIVSRWGGEEFLVFAYGETDYTMFRDSLMDLVNDISRFGFSYNEVSINTTISAGLTKYQKNDTIDDMVLRADHYLYKAKENGKNQLLGD